MLAWLSKRGGHRHNRDTNNCGEINEKFKKPTGGKSSIGALSRRNLYRDKKVASEKIRKKVAERWRVTQLGGRN